MANPLAFVPDSTLPLGPGGENNGLQPYGQPIVPVPVVVSTLTGTVPLPARPSTVGYTQPGVPAQFDVTFSGALSGAVTFTLGIASGYLPGDVVNVKCSATVVASHACTVQDGGSGTPNLGVIPTTTVTNGNVTAQLNAAGTRWLYEDGGSV